MRWLGRFRAAQFFALLLAVVVAHRIYFAATVSHNPLAIDNEAEHGSDLPQQSRAQTQARPHLHVHVSSHAFRSASHTADVPESELDPLISPFPLVDVELGAGTQLDEAFLTNHRYLMEILDADKLLANFYVTAGLMPRKDPYCAAGTQFSWQNAPGWCWEAPDSELRGHFVGHYLSALAFTWAAHRDPSAREAVAERAGYAVAEMAAVQEHSKTGGGWLSAFPIDALDMLHNEGKGWAPYYTLHKILAGLVDQYEILGNRGALDVAVKLAKCILSKVAAFVAARGKQHWFDVVVDFKHTHFAGETGGMNDVSYRLFRITGDADLWRLGELFDHPAFLRAMAARVDVLTDIHVNYHLPVAVGAATKYHVIHGRDHGHVHPHEPPASPHPDWAPLEAAAGAFETVVGTRMFATGGTGSREHWHGAHELGGELGGESEETCTQYNMIKLAGEILRGAPMNGTRREPVLSEYVERGFWNGIVGVQRGAGELLYTLPLAPAEGGAGAVAKSMSGHGWGRPDASFWCCYGTGIESFAKLNDGHYMRRPATRWRPAAVWVNLFASGTAKWAALGLELQQDAQVPLPSGRAARVTITVTAAPKETRHKHTEVSILLRVPSWATASESHYMWAPNRPSAFTVSVDGEAAACQDRQGGMEGYCEITRVWAPGMKLEATMPMAVTAEKLDDHRDKFSNLHAVMYGPFTMAAIADSSSANAFAFPSSGLAARARPVPPGGAHGLVTFTLASAKDIIIAHTDLFGQQRPHRMVAVDASVEHNSAIATACATFVVVPGATPHSLLRQGITARVVSLESFCMPGYFVTARGETVTVEKPPPSEKDTDENHRDRTFFMTKGLDGGVGTISFMTSHPEGMTGHLVVGTDDPLCKDTYVPNANCAKWSYAGECQRNPFFMLTACTRSCRACPIKASTLKVVPGPPGSFGHPGSRQRSAGTRARARGGGGGEGGEEWSDVAKAHASFNQGEPRDTYPPGSLIVPGVDRDYLMMPIKDVVNLPYTTYFKFEG